MDLINEASRYMYEDYIKNNKPSEILYRIYTKDNKIKFAGTDLPSYFVTAEEAKKYKDPTDTIYSYNVDLGRRMHEVF